MFATVAAPMYAERQNRAMKLYSLFIIQEYEEEKHGVFAFRYYFVSHKNYDSNVLLLTQ